MLKRLLTATLATTTILISCGSEPEQPQHPFSTEKTPAEQGMVIFKEKCSICHSKTQDIAGPALQGVMARWDNDANRLKAFIRNSQEIIRSGDPAAVKTFEKYKAPMPAFPSLTDEELNQLVDYLKD